MNERKKNTSFMHIGKLIETYMKQNTGGADSCLMEIIEMWNHKIDKKISENSKPDSIKNGVLTLKVISPAWSQHIAFIKKELAGLVNEGIGADIVKDIKCKIVSSL